MKKNVLIVAGEASGDIHAANLIANLKKLNREISFYGIGGARMLSEGVTIIERMEKLSIIGVSEIFQKLGHLRLAYRKIKCAAKETRPDIAILIDYPGFNLTLAKALKKMGIPIVYYITPQVWAWGKFRMRLIKKYVDKAIVILKFEEGILKNYGIDAEFVGHPLLDCKAPAGVPDKKSLGLNTEKLTIALLPGSRESEVKNMLPVMLKTGALIVKQKNVQFILLKSSGVGEDIYTRILERPGVPIASIKDNTHGCLAISDFVFVSSGTATLESAIIGRPMLITYKTSFFTALLFKIFAKTRFIGLVNIIAQREVAPEILQYNATPERLARGILSIITSKEKLEEQTRLLLQVRNSLGTPGASFRAANIINKFLNTK